MTRVVQFATPRRLDDYAAIGSLAALVAELRAEASQLVPQLADRTIWMVNSTERGGGVAELLPTEIALLRDLGIAVEWAVIEASHEGFFPLTKRIHNMVHGANEAPLTADDRALYERVSADNAAALAQVLAPADILVVHDPQPLGAGAIVKRELGVRTIWRCHIGLDERTAATEAAWAFLEPYAATYDDAVFSIPEYIPDFLAGRSTIIYPSLDPLSHKNRGLSLHKLVGILSDAALVTPDSPLIAPPFDVVAQRVQPDGQLAPATEPEEIGLLGRPIISQVSRWDRLKGFLPLLDAFRHLKEKTGGLPMCDERHRRRVENARLVLAGPDPNAIQDDPEARAVFDELRARYLELGRDVQREIALLALPMASVKENALMVNALQRAATIVAQNSLREGFGLTVTEAMWKGIPVLGNRQACGIRHQVRDGLDGCLVDDPEDAEALAVTIVQMLADDDLLETWGRNAERRVHEEFLVLRQTRRWVRLLGGAERSLSRAADTRIRLRGD